MRKVLPAALWVSLVSSPGWAAVSRDAGGWTVVTPSADSRVIYVSNSVGNDAFNGLAPDPMGGNVGPKKTIAGGMALLRTNVVYTNTGAFVNMTGYPDHILFRRGDVWTGGLGTWKYTGRSPQEPMVFGAYGAGERPRFESGGAQLGATGSEGIPSFHDVIFLSLHFYGTNAQGNDCVSWMRGGDGLLFEDMRFERCGVVFQSGDPQYPPHDVVRSVFRRSQFLDAYGFSGVRHSSGIFLNLVKEVLLEENTFDHCGWNETIPGAQPTIFNHCIYWQANGPAHANVVRNNIIMRASSHAYQLRSSGNLEGNLIVRNPIAGQLANDYDPAETNVVGVAVGNVVSEGIDILPRDGYPTGSAPRGWAISAEGQWGPGDWRVEVRDNIFTKSLGNQSQNFTASGGANVDFFDNIIWQWPGSRPQSAGPFPDPDRTVAAYNATLGGPATFDAFATEVRAQSKVNWRPEYTAPAVIAYFREGFIAPGGGDGVPPARPRGLRRR